MATIHKIPIKEFKKAKQRIINDIIPEDRYPNRNDFIKNIIDYLEKNHPKFEYNTFIHGDFHYANVLWENNKIFGVIDYEYSELGFKEQDIAWTLIPRPSQIFEITEKEINALLTGYRKINKFNFDYFRWCFINGCTHFYLMNQNNKEYTKKLEKIIKDNNYYNLEYIGLNMVLEEYNMYQEIPAKESGSTNLAHGIPFEVFPNYIESQLARAYNSISYYDTPTKIYIMYVNNYPVGYIGIRTKIDDNWHEWCGNIFYTIRPTERKKGYGTKILKLALN